MSTLPLFPEEPEIPPGALKTLNIAGDGRPLTKDQKRFNTLLGQVEALRQLQRDWETATGAFRDVYLRELAPRDAEVCALHVQLLELLDAAWEKAKLTKAERKKLQRVIIDHCVALLARRDDDEAAKALYAKHTHRDFDEDIGADEDAIRAAFESMLDEIMPGFGTRPHGSAADDFDPFDPANHDADGHIRHDADPVKPRKKTAKQLAREARQEEEQKQLGQSLKDIYRKLASSLHPDREPDADERTRKTGLMQQANEAYEQRNLLQLLELQLQVDHLDAARLASLSEERLKRYNVLLKQQLESMSEALDMYVYEFLDQYGMDELSRANPQEPMRLLRHDLRSAKKEIADLKQVIAAVEHPAGLKTYLKSLRSRRADPFF